MEEAEFTEYAIFPDVAHVILLGGRHIGLIWIFGTAQIRETEEMRDASKEMVYYAIEKVHRRQEIYIDLVPLRQHIERHGVFYRI